MKKMTERNLQHATEAALEELKQPNPVIEADAKLVQDRSMDRAHFQGRFRATTYGDFKNRSGHGDEHSEALQDDYVFEEAKTERELAQAAIVDAAAADGVIVEDHELHRLADDGGPVHE